MAEVKRPEFDLAQEVLISQDTNLDEPMKWGDVVLATGKRFSVKYEGLNVDLMVTRVLSDDEAVGRIIGIGNTEMQYQGLSRGDEVAFKRKHVCGVSRSTI